MAKHHPDLVMCRKQPGVAIGRLCEKDDGKCVICDSYVRPCTLVRICDECNYGSYQGRCVICGGPGISDASAAALNTGDANANAGSANGGSANGGPATATGGSADSSASQSNSAAVNQNSMQEQTADQSNRIRLRFRLFIW